MIVTEFFMKNTLNESSSESFRKSIALKSRRLYKVITSKKYFSLYSITKELSWCFGNSRSLTAMTYLTAVDNDYTYTLEELTKRI